MAEHCSRSHCLEIVGVPEIERGDGPEAISYCAGSMSGQGQDFKIKDKMINAVHTLSKIPSKPNVEICRHIDMESMRKKSIVQLPSLDLLGRAKST